MINVKVQDPRSLDQAMMSVTLHEQAPAPAEVDPVAHKDEQWQGDQRQRVSESESSDAASFCGYRLCGVLSFAGRPVPAVWACGVRCQRRM